MLASNCRLSIFQKRYGGSLPIVVLVRTVIFIYIETGSPSRGIRLVRVYCGALMPSGDTRLFFHVRGFLVGLEQGLLDVGGNEFVAAEGHGEGTAAAGEGAQSGAVAVHLGQGSLGFQSGVLAFGIHAHNNGAASPISPTTPR